MVSEDVNLKRVKMWSAKSKRNLETAFTAINPCSEKDWLLISDALANKWTVDEIKDQAKKMKLEPAQVVKKLKRQDSTLKKLCTLTPKGKLPNRGTIHREELEEEVMRQLFVVRDDTEINTTVNDSADEFEDQFIHEVMREHALDSNITETVGKFKPLPRRTFFPRSISSSRSVESQEELNSVGDDFSMPDRKGGYKYKYRAQQFCRRSTRKVDKTEESE